MIIQKILNSSTKNIHLDPFMYNLILPLETYQHLFKRCSLRNMKFTSSCLMVIKRMHSPEHMTLPVPLRFTLREKHGGSRLRVM